MWIEKSKNLKIKIEIESTPLNLPQGLTPLCGGLYSPLSGTDVHFNIIYAFHYLPLLGTVFLTSKSIKFTLIRWYL